VELVQSPPWCERSGAGLGHAAAAAAELHHVRDVLVRYVASRVAGVQDTEDIVQDVLLAAAASAQQRHGDLLPYVLGIARYKCADWWRAVRADRVSLVADPPDVSDPSPSPEDAAVQAENIAWAQRLLAGLNERDGELLRLRMSGATAAEAGMVLGMTAGAVRVAQHRAMQQLRERIRVDGGLSDV
jgi:RNA polymerase sigma-70 factor (ECF subfamily)